MHMLICLHGSSENLCSQVATPETLDPKLPRRSNFHSGTLSSSQDKLTFEMNTRNHKKPFKNLTVKASPEVTFRPNPKSSTPAAPSIHPSMIRSVNPKPRILNPCLSMHQRLFF